jgi:hypothetical protein
VHITGCLRSCLILLPLVATSALAAQDQHKHVEVPAIAARPDDVHSIDDIMKVFYDVISGPKGQPRQWARDGTLYTSDMRFIALSKDKQGKPRVQIWSHEQFVDYFDAELVDKGFYEKEIHRVTQRFGNIVHVFSTYESRNIADGPVIARGINSIELFWDGKRWWIAIDTWDDERPDNPIPREYLP